MPLLKAFVARSFLEDDERRLAPILTFLDTFAKVGFICQSADAAEVQSVSAKVRKLIDESDVFIGFFTRRYPVYDLRSGLSGAWQVGRGIQPQLWSAPAWVLQESGYALQKLGTGRLILLREPNVEVFGLQGDLEYIPFSPERSTDVQSKLNEMILSLVAKASGTEVAVVVTHPQGERETAEEPMLSASNTEVPKEDDQEATDLVARYLEMTAAAGSRDFDAINDAWKAGVSLIEDGKKEGMDRISWDCELYALRFEAGDADGLENLRAIGAEHPERWEPIVTIARCLQGSKEYEESAAVYVKGAGLITKPNSKALYLIRAAEAYYSLREYEKGKEAVYSALSVARGNRRREAISVLYRLLQAEGGTYLAFATAESALHENPQFDLRFKLALDYHRENINDLALYHFKFLHEHDQSDASSLHNLALLRADQKLPISAVEGYKKAFELGETLSAANLGYIYLNCGMAEEAKRLVLEAMKLEGHAPEVEKCLSDVIERTEAERSKESDLLTAAGANRDLLISMGQAFWAKSPSLQGQWNFPFGEMALTSRQDRVTGSVDIKQEQTGLRISGLFADRAAAPPIVKHLNYRFYGKLTGAVCSFQLTMTDVTPSNASIYTGALAGLLSSQTKKSGFMLFNQDETTAVYMEVADGKLGKPETITKLK